VKRTTEQRFLSKVRLSNGCWIWTGHVEKNGYGRIGVNGKMRWAHRIAYELFIGLIPKGKELDHLCRVPACVNPRHLEPVTHKENMRRSPLGAGVMHKAKTKCPQGHDYSFENTYIFRGMRYCRVCARKYKAAYKARKKNEKSLG
jgi:hypothetical protein